MEIPLITKLISSIKVVSQSADSLTIKPGILAKIGKVANPVQQKFSLTTYSQPGYLKNSILQIQQQMKKTYGKLPLWINYSMSPLAVSWNLGSVEANHDLLIYGAKQFVQEFSSLFQHAAQQSNLSSSIIQQTVAKDTSSIEASKIEPLSPAISKNTGSSTPNGLIGSLGAIAGIISVAMAISLMKKKKTTQINRGKALELAMDQVSELVHNQPILQSEKARAKRWEFLISGYQVFVNKIGVVEKISKAGVTI